MTLGSHQIYVGKSQVYATPRWILDALGPFDFDPCAITPPRPWDCAKVNIIEAQDGLIDQFVACGHGGEDAARAYLKQREEKRNGKQD
jgi:hypothetical protein